MKEIEKVDKDVTELVNFIGFNVINVSFMVYLIILLLVGLCVGISDELLMGYARSGCILWLISLGILKVCIKNIDWVYSKFVKLGFSSKYKGIK